MGTEVSQAAAQAFLDWLYAGIEFGVHTENRIVISSRGFQKNSWCFDPSAAARLIMNDAKTGDTFYRVAVLKGGDGKTDKGRGKASDAKIIPAFCFDFDCDASGEKKTSTATKKVPRSIDEIFAAIEKLPAEMRPNKLIRSGVGCHAYWKLAEPYEIKDHAEATAYAKGWDHWLAAFFEEQCGYQLDRTGELARVLRLPGTLHHKGDPLPVYEIETDITRDEPYKIGEFEFAATAYKQSITKPVPSRSPELPGMDEINDGDAPKSRTAKILHAAAVSRMLACKASEIARSGEEKDGSNRVVTYCRIAVGTGLTGAAAMSAVDAAVSILPTPTAVNPEARLASVMERGETPVGCDLAGISTSDEIRQQRVNDFVSEAEELTTDDAELRFFAMGCLAVDFDLSVAEFVDGMREIEKRAPLVDLPFIEDAEPLTLTDGRIAHRLIEAVGSENVGKVDRKIVSSQRTERILAKLRSGGVDRKEGQNAKYALIAAETLFCRMGMRADGSASEAIGPIVAEFASKCEPKIASPEKIVADAIKRGDAANEKAGRKAIPNNEDRDAILAACADAGGDPTTAADEMRAEGDYVEQRISHIAKTEYTTGEEARRKSTLKIVRDDPPGNDEPGGVNATRPPGTMQVVKMNPRDACYSVVRSVVTELHIWVPDNPKEFVAVDLKTLRSASGWIAFDAAWLRLTGHFLPLRYRGKAFEMFMSNVVERNCSVVEPRDEDPIVYVKSMITNAIAWARDVSSGMDDLSRKKLPSLRNVRKGHFDERGLSTMKGLRIQDPNDETSATIESKPRGFSMDHNLNLLAHSPTIVSALKSQDFQIIGGIRSMIIGELQTAGFEQSKGYTVNFWKMDSSAIVKMADIQG
ncbi:hypothetical protein [Kordiimonas sp.]|uniref:hypothetical protein n=1 Tax=Kordiimonas sp. TaxID=1970157 RepID=UPI003A8F457C